MQLDELKHCIGALSLSDLEALGFDIDDESWDDEVLMMFTSDEHNEEHNEATTVAAINSEDLKLITISNGQIVPDKNDPEVGRVFVNEEKAEMILEAMRHAFPELLKQYASGNRVRLRRYKGNDEARLLSLPSLDGSKNIAAAIKTLQKAILDLRNVRKKGWEFSSKARGNAVTIKPKKLVDKCIDVHQALKEQLSVKLGEEAEVFALPLPEGRNTYIAAAPKSGKVLLIQVCVEDLAADNSLRDARIVEITEKVGKSLLHQMQRAF